MKRLIYLFFAAILLSGCVTNPFKQFYTDYTGGVDIAKDPRVIISSEKPKLLQGGRQEEDEARMFEDNYTLLGYSSFNSGEVDGRQAIERAKEVGASVVLVYSRYTDTRSGALPLTLPNTQTASTTVMGSVGSVPYYGSAQTTTTGTSTTYVPYNVNRYDYFATYWIKMRPPVLGVVVQDLTPEARKQVGSNKGVLVEAVVKGTPAFAADLFKGDIIQRIEGKDIVDAKYLQDYMAQLVGQKVNIEILRDGKQITKIVQLNPKQ